MSEKRFLKNLDPSEKWNLSRNLNIRFSFGLLYFFKNRVFQMSEKRFLKNFNPSEKWNLSRNLKIRFSFGLLFFFKNRVFQMPEKRFLKNFLIHLKNGICREI